MTLHSGPNPPAPFPSFVFTGAISGFPYLANMSLKASATRLCRVVLFCTARIFSWSRTCLGKCTVMGLVPPRPFCSPFSFGAVVLAAAAGCRMAGFLWRALPPVSASSSVRLALVLMVFLLGFGFGFQLDESAQNILVDL